MAAALVVAGDDVHGGSGVKLVGLVPADDTHDGDAKAPEPPTSDPFGLNVFVAVGNFPARAAADAKAAAVSAITDDTLVERLTYGPSAVSDVKVTAPQGDDATGAPDASDPTPTELGGWLAANRLPPTLEAVLHDAGFETVEDLEHATDPAVREFIEESGPYNELKLVRRSAFWKALAAIDGNDGGGGGGGGVQPQPPLVNPDDGPTTTPRSELGQWLDALGWR